MAITLLELEILILVINIYKHVIFVKRNSFFFVITTIINDDLTGRNETPFRTVHVKSDYIASGNFTHCPVGLTGQCNGKMNSSLLFNISDDHEFKFDHKSLS